MVDGAAVVSDGHPLVVGQQRILRTKERANVGGMIDRGVEIRVVADLNRQNHFDVLLRTQAQSGLGCDAASPRRAAQIERDATAASAPDQGPSKDSGATPCRRHRCGHPPRPAKRRSAAAPRSSTWSPIATQRLAHEFCPLVNAPKGRFWIGKSQPCGIGRLNEGACAGIVSLVSFHVHRRSSSRSSLMGSSNEQEPKAQSEFRAQRARAFHIDPHRLFVPAPDAAHHRRSASWRDLGRPGKWPSAATRNSGAGVNRAPGDCGGGKNVQDIRASCLGRVGFVGKRTHPTQGMMQPRGGLERHAQLRATRNEFRHRFERRNCLGHHSPGTQLGATANAPQNGKQLSGALRRNFIEHGRARRLMPRISSISSRLQTRTSTESITAPGALRLNSSTTARSATILAEMIPLRCHGSGAAFSCAFINSSSRATGSTNRPSAQRWGWLR